MAMKRYSLKKTAKKRCISNRGWIGGKIPQISKEMLEMKEQMRQLQIENETQVLNDPPIYGITLVLYPHQKVAFSRYIGENVRYIPTDENERRDVFIRCFAYAYALLSESQKLIYKSLSYMVHSRNPLTPQEIRSTFDEIFADMRRSRSASGGKKYHKRFTRKK